MAAGDELAFLAEEGRVVDGEQHAHRRFIHLELGQTLGVLGVGHGVADVEVLQAHQRHDLAAAHFRLDLLLAKAFEDHKFLDLAFGGAALILHQADLLTGLDGAPGHAAHGDTALERAVVQRGDAHLQRTGHLLRRGHVFQDHVQQVAHVLGRGLPVRAHPTVLAAAVHGGEVELVLRGIQREHQVEDGLVYLIRGTVGLVHLIDHHHGLQAQLDGLAQHEARLRHRPFEGVHQQDHAVRHVEHALHLTAEITVAGGVDDVDLHVLVVDAHVLAENGDAAFALQVVVVQQQVLHLLVRSEELALVQDLVHQCGLAVVDVCDDGDVAEVLHT